MTIDRKQILHACVLGAALCAALPLAARAEEPVVVLETVQATTYVNGGIGDGEQARMRRVAAEFPLRMTFSVRKDGEFIADVPVQILDMKGMPVFELSRAGPMLFVSLPDGRYRVLARYKGLTESQQVTVGGKSGKDLNFHWADAVAKQ
jgi:hypothetical protein